MNTPRLVAVTPSKLDATIKYVYLSRENHTLEIAVIDKSDGKIILCVPTQTNCAMACRFCHTTKMAGKVPVINLSSEEIVACAQDAYQASLDEHCIRRISPAKPILVSFMGCGEPMANVSNVLGAMQMFQKLWAYPGVRFGVATMLPTAHVTDFMEFGAEVARHKLPVKLHLSLHFMDEQTRRRFMPAAHSIAASAGLLRWYQGATGNPVEIHYTLINGVNDDLATLEQLAALLVNRGFPIKFLYFSESDAQPLRPTDAAWTSFIKNFFEQKLLMVEFYDPPGRDISCSCGQFYVSNYTELPLVTISAAA